MHSDAGLRRAAVVIGRSAELDALDGAVGAARAGEATCVVLVGEGGIGKTRLVDESVARAAQLGLGVLAGRAPIASPVPFGIISEALRSWLREHPLADALGPFDRGLALVLPEWPDASAADDLEPGAAGCSPGKASCASSVLWSRRKEARC